MNLDIAQGIAEAGQNEGIDIEVYHDYSGRGMYGRTTAGLQIQDIGDFGTACAAYGYKLCQEGKFLTFGKLTQELMGTSQDSLGRGLIVY